ncbi:hypothetical protein BCR39DRAFT_539252 [Naematelia encephala]|uniref:SHSP domain-containing protein n=1 Tax=Naematelia encephala TaxID=71784 RepID=A0A1Y2AXT7_9TREE|nr:hypothetical protein BCR39DRAFT_539252 [Naematelia encephala]
MTASRPSAALRDTSPLKLPPSLPLTAAHSSPSPTSASSTASFSSIFDSSDFSRYYDQGGMSDGLGGNLRRESADSMTSWGSTSGAPGWTGAEDEDEKDRAVGKSELLGRHPSQKRPSVGSKSSSNDSVTTAASLQPVSTPPDIDMVNDFESYEIRQGAPSPTSSVTSTAPSKGDSTPRAELSAPVWPLAALSPRSLQAKTLDDSMDIDMSPRKEGSEGYLRKANPIRPIASWRQKHASLDTPTTSPSPFAVSYDMREHASLPQKRSSPSLDQISTPNLVEYVPPQKQTTKQGLSPIVPESKRRSGEFVRDSPPADHRVVAESEATGCLISAPISPPAHYPVLSAQSLTRRFSNALSASTTSSSASIASSSSSKSRDGGSRVAVPPRWAQPPHHINAISGRAQSFSAGDSREVDFDPELFDGAEGEWIEIIKGSEGRIAVKSTPTTYAIMVWLPGFSLDNILITTKGQRTVHIVADHWDEGDHAQWDIRLGDDADMRAVSAKFSGAELRVSIARHVKASQYARFFRSSSASAVSAPAAIYTPSIPGTSVNLSAPAAMTAAQAISLGRPSIREETMQI